MKTTYIFALLLSFEVSAKGLMPPLDLDGDWRLVASSCADQSAKTGRTDFESIQIQGNQFWYSQQADRQAMDPSCTPKASGKLSIDNASIRFTIEQSSSCDIRVVLGVDSAGRNLVNYAPQLPRMSVLTNPTWSLDLFMGQEAIVELSDQPQLCPRSKYKAVFSRLGSS